MKAKRIIALLLVAVLSLGVLASCGSSDSAADNSGELKKLSISDVYNTEADFSAYMENNKTYTSHTDYTFLAEKSVLDDSDIFVLYENTSVDPIKYTVYNLALAKEVLSIEASKVSDIELDDYYFSVVTVDENGKEKTTVYNNKGEVIYTTDGYYSPDSFGMFLRLGNSVYSTNPDYSLTKICDLPPIIDGDIEYMQFIVLDDAYLMIDTDEDGYVYSIAYYSKDFKLISAYIPNSYFDDFGYAILANGNALITGTEYLEEDATEFDFYGDGEKVKVSYFIFDYKENSTTEIDLGDYVLSDGWVMNELMYSYISSDADFYDIFNEDVENIARLYKINNQRIDYSVSYEAVIDNDGTIAGYANSQVPYQYESAQPWGNYYVAYTDFSSYILDKDGDVLLEIPSNDIEFTEFGVYDYNTDKLYSFNESTKSLDLVKDFSDCYIEVQEYDFMLYSKYNEESGLEDYYFYSKTGGEKKVAVPQGFEISVDYYGDAYYEVLSDELFCFTMYSYNEETYEYTYEYHYYNNAGTFLFKSELVYDYYKTFDSYAIIEAYNDETGKYVYKKLSVAAPVAQ